MSWGPYFIFTHLCIMECQQTQDVIDLSDRMETDPPMSSAGTPARTSLSRTQMIEKPSSSTDGSPPLKKRRRVDSTGPVVEPSTGALVGPAGPKVKVALLCEGPHGVLAQLRTAQSSLDRFGDPLPLATIRVGKFWLKVIDWEDHCNPRSDFEGEDSDGSSGPEVDEVEY